MSSPEKPGSGASPSGLASPRLNQRTFKLNPVSAPGFKPVAPPSNSTHCEQPPLAKQTSSSSLNRRDTKLQLQPTNPARSGTTSLTSSLVKRGGDKPDKLTFLTDSNKHTSSSSPSSVPFLPSPTSPLSPHGDSGTFSSRLKKTGALSRNQPTQPEVTTDKQYPIRDRTNVFEFGQDDYSSATRARSNSRGDRIQVPSLRNSRSPSPMSRRKQMSGNTLSPVPGSPFSVPDAGLVSGQEGRRVSPSKSPSISPVNQSESPRATPTISSETQNKNFASLGFKAIVGNKINEDSARGRSKGANTPATSLTTGSNSLKKSSSNRIDITYSMASPLSPRKRQPAAGDPPNINDAFQDNYRFFLRDNSDASRDGDNKSNNNDDRMKTMFSPAPVRDIFSPMPSTQHAESCSGDFLDSCIEINLPFGSVKEGKKTSSPGITFPAIRVENVDDSSERKGNVDQSGTLNDTIGQGGGVIGCGRRSRSVTSSSGSSSSTSPSPTTPPPMEFSRFKPSRAKSTNTLLSAEATKVIDSWLSPTLSPTLPPGSSPPTRHHPDDARLSWRKSSSSSTSCLLSVPPPLIKRQTSEGRLIVGVPDALRIPGEGGAGKKGMKSRGWSRSESNLFVRTGRPVGGAGEGEVKAELEEYEETPSGSRRISSTTQPLATITQKGLPGEENTTLSSGSPSEWPRKLKGQDLQEKVPREPLTPPNIHTPDESDCDLPVLSPRPPSKPRPSYRGT